MSNVARDVDFIVTHRTFHVRGITRKGRKFACLCMGIIDKKELQKCIKLAEDCGLAYVCHYYDIGE